MNQKGWTVKNAFEPVKFQKTSDFVADLLRKSIIEGKFKPGEFLPPERELSRQLQVTRNTVREALRQLEKERLVSIRQGRGIKVENFLETAGIEVANALIFLKEVGEVKVFQDIIEARSVIGYAMIEYSLNNLSKSKIKGIVNAIDRFVEEADKKEPSLTRLQELDFEIHNKIIEAGGNMALLLLHNSIRHTYKRTYKLFSWVVIHPEKLKTYYLEIKEALERGSLQKAKTAFKKYFKFSESTLKKFFEGGES